jgi:hypothetical protein
MKSLLLANELGNTHTFATTEMFRLKDSLMKMSIDVELLVIETPVASSWHPEAEQFSVNSGIPNVLREVDSNAIEKISAIDNLVLRTLIINKASPAFHLIR